MRRLSFLFAGAAMLAFSGCGQPAGVPATGAGTLLAPQQIHAIPIGTPPPTTTSCSGDEASCNAKERTDIPAIPNSPWLKPENIPGLHPVDLQSAYNLPSATAGYGTTVAIVVAFSDPNAESDMAVYRSKFGPPACTQGNGCLHFYSETGVRGHRAPKNSGWSTEESIDLDMTSAICPNCNIAVVEATDSKAASLVASLRQAIALRPAVVSNSWTIPEKQFKHPPQVLAHAHVAVVAGTGDKGAGVAWPAADADVIAVGGTTLMRSATVPRGWFEQAWSGAGYGCSMHEMRPAWQPATLCATRGVADIAAVADPLTGVAIYDTYGKDRGHHDGHGGWEVFGGTSVATQIVGAAIALSRTGSDLSNAGPIYSNARALNPVYGGGLSPLQAGLGTPNGTAAF